MPYSFLFLLLVTLGTGYQALACPPRQGEDKLTFQRIMINLGRMTLKADLLVREMNQQGQTRENKIEALQDLSVAIQCAQISAQAAAADNDADLLPSGLRTFSAEAREQYLSHYYKMMMGFSRLLEQYQEQISQEKFSEAANTAQKMNRVTDVAHNLLRTSSYCEDVLARGK